MTDPVLYVLMRTDLASMNPGKGMAQASHAYGALKKTVHSNIPMQVLYIEWMNQSRQEFGVTVVLGGSEGEIQDMMNGARKHLNPPVMVCGWVHDDSYPIKDGDVTHEIQLNTCAFMFGRGVDLQDFITLERHQ